MTSQLFYEMTSNSCSGPHVCYVLGTAVGYKKNNKFEKSKKEYWIHRNNKVLHNLGSPFSTINKPSGLAAYDFYIVLARSCIVLHPSTCSQQPILVFMKLPFCVCCLPNLSTWLWPVNTIIAHHDFLLTVKLYLLGNVLSTWTTVNFDCLKNVFWWTNPNKIDSYQLYNLLLLAHTDSHTYIRTKMT